MTNGRRNANLRSTRLGTQQAEEISSPPIPLVVSTRNVHKMREIRAIIGDTFRLLDLSGLPQVPAIQETGETFEENATLKAVGVSHLYDGWVIGEDSGLEVDALGGGPGVYSARYSGTGATDTRNNELLLRNLENFAESERKARFHCVIVLALSGRKLAAFDGIVEGKIDTEPRGDRGFGYDALFVPNGFGETFGQLPARIKNRLSHRFQALNKLRSWKGWVEQTQR
jgi:XTP/dITP diphosphohydrolase